MKLRNVFTLFAMIGSLGMFSQTEGQPEANPFENMFARPTNIQDAYTFDHQVEMEVEVKSATGSPINSGSYEMYVNESKPFFGIHVEENGTDIEMIFDMEEKQMITLTTSEGNQIGFVVSLTDEIMDKAQENNDMNFSKTNEEKEILGYECVLYTAEDETSKSEYWVCTDSELDLSDVYSMMIQNNPESATVNYPEGLIVEMNSVDKASGDITVMTLKGIEKNVNKKMDTTAYNIMKMN